MNVLQIRRLFVDKLNSEDFVVDKSGVKTIEIIGSSFVADKPSIFGKVNEDYVKRELDWYNSMSLKVDDIPGGPPQIWKDVSSKTDGEINSNYGYLIYSDQNGRQYENVKAALTKDPNTRRAVMIYTRPTMHVDYNRDGMSDFVCTNTVAYTIRNGLLHAVVNMRSNDAVFGYKNDYAWQKYVLDKLANELNIKPGSIYWQTTSLHVYERHFHLVTI